MTFSNDVITLGTCSSMFVYMRALFRFVMNGGNLTAQSTGSHRGIRGGSKTLETQGTFHLPDTLRNLNAKVHRVKNVFHLTQVPFVYALVTKIQDGGTDVAVNSLQPLIPRKKFVNGTCVSNGKTGLPFQFSSYNP